jgi:putative flippase GtrA
VPTSPRLFITEAQRYVVVGGFGFILDTLVFNLLSLTNSFAFFSNGQLINKTLATALAVTFTYIANSRWTFRHRTGRSEGFSRMLRYLLVSASGLAVSLICLLVSREILGFQSLIADNISANVVGVGLAAVLRFLANRKWVFIEGQNNQERRL